MCSGVLFFPAKSVHRARVKRVTIKHTSALMSFGMNWEEQGLSLISMELSE